MVLRITSTGVSQDYVNSKPTNMNFQIVLPNATQLSCWFVELSDLTIRSKAIGVSYCKADHRGNLIADLKPSVGLTTEEVRAGAISLLPQYKNSFFYGGGTNRKTFIEVLSNAVSICNAMNKQTDQYQATVVPLRNGGNQIGFAAAECIMDMLVHEMNPIVVQ